jgi:hypothetical protein
MVAYEETSSLQVLGTVTADAVVTVSLALFSFDGSVHDALFPPSFPARPALAAALFDILLMLIIRACISIASVTGSKACTRPCGIFLAFVLHSTMAVWCDTRLADGVTRCILHFALLPKVHGHFPHLRRGTVWQGLGTARL